MTIRSLAVSFGLACFLVVAPRAQEGEGEPPTILISSWMCDRAALNDLEEDTQQRALPILQDLVNEGQLWSATALRHAWGDEWNFVSILVASDLETAIAANSEMNRRYEETYGDDGFDFLPNCWTHRDAVHTGVWETQAPEGAEHPTEGVVAMSAFACDFSVLGDVSEDSRASLLPATQASVDAGMGHWAGASVHAWADEWNFVIWRYAADMNSLMEFVEDTNDRITEEGPGPLGQCRMHKDNLYWVMAETIPPQE